MREQITGIEERADQEIAKLDEEQEKIEKAYEEQQKAQNLRAEAEKLLMKSSQKEILKLIGEFAPEYDAALSAPVKGDSFPAHSLSTACVALPLTHW